MVAHYFLLALRNIKQSKVLSSLMVLAVAMGIAACMSTLTVLHVMSGDPLPGRSARLFHPVLNPSLADGADGKSTDMLDYTTAMDLWRAHRADVQVLSADSMMTLQAPQTTLPPIKALTLAATGDFFSAFDVRFRFGSGWLGSDDEKHARVAVISDHLNNRLFGGRDSTGKIIRLNDQDFRVMGVLAPWRPAPLFYDVGGFRDKHGNTAILYSRGEDIFVPFLSGLDANPDGFSPLSCWGDWQGPASLIQAPCEWVMMWVRLDDKEKIATYAAFLKSYAAEQKALGRYRYADGVHLYGLLAWLDYNQVVPSNVRLQTWLALGFLLVCLGNTVALLLTKFMRRSIEFGIRRALGATRTEILTQCLMESGLIGLLGGLAGWLLALGSLSMIRHQQTTYSDLVRMDGTMLIGTFALSITATMIAGLLPAIRASRVAPGLHLKAE